MKKISTTFVAIGLFLSSSMAGELFVKVNQTGSFFATYGTQVQYNTSGIFRFFDLAESNSQLMIQNQTTGQTIANTWLNIPNNERKIGEITRHGGFRLLKTEYLTYVNWYTVNTQPVFPNMFPTKPIVCSNSSNNVWNGMNDQDFQGFVQQLKIESFDSSRLKSAKQFVKNNLISAAQIKQITDVFSFDSSRLEWAKYAYDYCWNQGNYYLLRPAFNFSSSYDELQDYIVQK